MTAAITASSFRRELTAPMLPAVPDAQLQMAHDPAAPRCEEVRALRTELLLRPATTDGSEVIALLSPHAGEGRSLLAAELAIALAQTGQATLLIDADLRHPRQQLLFAASCTQGLAESIGSGTTPRLQAVQGVPHLSLLVAGEQAQNPLELLCSGAFAALLRDWRTMYRFIVLDTAPVMRYPDGMAVASHADRVLALCRARYTPYRDMQELLRRLSVTRSRQVGAVINHF